MSTSRRRHQVEEEDAAQLKLGSEFNNAGCLLISEVKYLLGLRKMEDPDTMVYKRTMEYVQTFSKFYSDDATTSVRQALGRDQNLAQFEIAQIANLCPGTAEEAKNCIPSLVKLSDSDLQGLLDEVGTLQKFQG